MLTSLKIFQLTKTCFKIVKNCIVRRNDELALLYEKIKLQQATMNKGEIQYRQRMEDLRVLKLEIRKLQREKVILNKSVSSIEELRREIFHTQVYYLPLFYQKFCI